MDLSRNGTALVIDPQKHIATLIETTPACFGLNEKPVSELAVANFQTLTKKVDLR